MSRVQIPVLAASMSGTVIPEASWVTGDNVDGHYFENDGRTVLLCRNISLAAADATVTILPDFTRDTLSLEDLAAVLAMPALAPPTVHALGTYRKETFNQRSGDFKGSVIFDVDTDEVQFIAVRLP
jgi:hypothetical protein